ncbi:MAG TPA: helix-turn-helix domain-containing protein [Roseiflexaceae bacterium]|nr:helix-turn-helix domain-containing protein [Roseiflexaceae bacterium]
MIRIEPGNLGRSAPTSEPTSIRRVLTLDSASDDTLVERVLKALDSVNRMRILRYLTTRNASVNEIATALDLPLSTAALHVETLEEAGLIQTELEPASRGLRKMCARMYDTIVLDLPRAGPAARPPAIELAMPIGAFSDCRVAPTCGLASGDGLIGMVDDPASFYEPARVDAQLIWFRSGWVEYHFPNRLPAGSQPVALTLSMEICSEAPHHHPDWPSDITIWINGVEVGTWTSPADFGGEAGMLTPAWWYVHDTQYGLLKFWHVDGEGSKIDGLRISDVTIADLHLTEAPYIAVRIGVKPDAQHVGGINLFGSKFGNYPQDLVLRLSYQRNGDRPA